MEIFKRVFKNKSNKNIFTLLVGTGTAQAIPVLASLILTRLYTPEEYGLFAVFTSIVTMLATVVTLRYELAILVPKKEQDAINITVLSIISTIIISVILFVFLIIFKNHLLKLLNITDLGNWLYLVPLTLLFMGIYNSLNYLATRVGIFKVISKSRIYQTLSGSLSQVVLGLTHLGVGGLIIGSSVTNFMGNIKLFSNVYKSNTKEFKNISIAELKILAKKYSDYPKYGVPSSIFNNASIQLMSFIIPIFYSATLLGFYSLSQRIVITPMRVIGSAISQVFLNEASKELKERNTVEKSFMSTLKKLIIIAFPLYSVLFFSIEDIITFAFGTKWQPAGEITKILVLLLFFRFVVNPLSNVLNLYEKQKIVLLWQISLVCLTIGSLALSKILGLDFYSFLKLYVFLLSVNYVIMFFICYFTSRRHKQ
ncbi:oligosaccharide flippase family protein [Sediminibacillus halophilus]|uniref:Membrane protein involved in the export of O-antigen and teichoic acid n=1 Tax=Sediminibacillus halophilus TaxID=482461 RepID=A0A1G9U982_9BACI|nr:oligosaccharide flippase family protein [Sediminibacillus halophilus]SDM56480.1 Membrane protein involved in the export of O-antigen and teichoic acid [Sediminibacillus halophilus]